MSNHDAGRNGRHALGIGLWSVLLWVVVVNVPLIPPPSSYSSGDDDDPLLIQRNVLETAPPATLVAIGLLIIVSMAGLIPASARYRAIVAPDDPISVMTVASRVITGLIIASVVAAAVVVLLGASITTNVPATVLLGTLLAALTSVAPAISFGASYADWHRAFLHCRFNDWMEREFVVGAFGGIIGAWVSSSALALDWDYSFQTYPVPNVIGAIGGFTATIFAHSIALAVVPSWAGRRPGVKQQ